MHLHQWTEVGQVASTVGVDIYVQSVFQFILKLWQTFASTVHN